MAKSSNLVSKAGYATVSLKEGRYIESPWETEEFANLPSPYEEYIDRQQTFYYRPIREEGPNAPVKHLFWRAFTNGIATYKLALETREDKETIFKDVLSGVITHIGNNEERWIQQYGIDLASIQKYDATSPYKKKIFKLLHELAFDYAEQACIE